MRSADPSTDAPARPIPAEDGARPSVARDVAPAGAAPAHPAGTDSGRAATATESGRAARAPAHERPAQAEAGSHRPPLPGLNSALAKEALTRFIQTQVRQAGAKGVVIGLSGGIDSAATAAVSVAAVGPGSVQGLLLPSRWTDKEDLQHAREHAEALGIRAETVRLDALLQAYEKLVPEASRVREGNFTARLRMALLYDRSARDGLLVAGTANKTEALLGYTTLWGDMAAAFGPLGDLYKTQVRILAEHLGVSRAIRDKAPSAGLWAGQTDEDELGASYEELDRLLFHYVDLRWDLQALVAAGFDEAFARRTIARVHANEFKRRMPLAPKLSNRTIGHDWLYPRHWGPPEWRPHPQAGGGVIETREERGPSAS